MGFQEGDQFVEVAFGEKHLEKPVIANVVLLPLLVPLQNVDEKGETGLFLLAESADRFHVTHHPLSLPLLLLVLRLDGLDAVVAVGGLENWQGRLSPDSVAKAVAAGEN
jgi:hypothetical protein